jgi:hypothetical protein
MRRRVAGLPRARLERGLDCSLEAVVESVADAQAVHEGRGRRVDADLPAVEYVALNLESAIARSILFIFRSFLSA